MFAVKAFSCGDQEKGLEKVDSLFTIDLPITKLKIALLDEGAGGFSTFNVFDHGHNSGKIHIHYQPEWEEDTMVVIEEWYGGEIPNPTCLNKSKKTETRLKILQHIGCLLVAPEVSNGEMEKKFYARKDCAKLCKKYGIPNLRDHQGVISSMWELEHVLRTKDKSKPITFTATFVDGRWAFEIAESK